MGGISPDQIHHVAVSRDPKANLHKKILHTRGKGPQLAKLVLDRLGNVAKVRNVGEAPARASGGDRLPVRFDRHGTS